MTDPVDFLVRAAIRLQRSEIERLTEALITAMDALDGDTDVELNGDEADKSGDEGDYSINERIDQSEPVATAGNDQFNAGVPEDAEDDDPVGSNAEDDWGHPLAGAHPLRQ